MSLVACCLLLVACRFSLYAFLTGL
jgi:hypothetical protein